MDEEEVLNNISNLSAEQLSDQINNGIVTMSQLMQTGTLDNIKRRKITELQEERQLIEDQAWNKAEFGTEDDLLEYIRSFPKGTHVEEAKFLVKNKRKKEAEKEAEKQRVLAKIKKEPNYYRQNQINEFIKNKTITKDDLINSGIPEEVVDLLNKTPIDFELGDTPNSIPEGYTEVYFWGVPGSGKTTALSAVLSRIDRDGSLEIPKSSGYAYMVQLKNLFSDDYTILPNPTLFEKTQYLPFVIRENANKKAHSISLIELSGEIFECFYFENAGLPQKTEKHQKTFDTLLRYIKSDNRKLHFFFIDYHRGNEKDSDGLKQIDFLSAATTYFNDHNIFKKTTDAIYVVVTKSDLMNLPKDKWVEGAKEHIEENRYLSFTNSLKTICKKNSINGEKLTVEPFSIGDVYFRKFCEYDDSTSKDIIEILKKRITAKGKSILDVFNN